MSANKSELVLGAGLSYAGTALSLLSTLLLTPFIIRLLGQSDYGLFETIGSFINYLAIFDFGFSAVVIRYTAKYGGENNQRQRDEFLYTCRRVYRWLCLCIGCLGLLLCVNLDVFFAERFTAEEMTKARSMAFIVLATTMVSIYSQVYKGALTGIEKFVYPRLLAIAKTIVAKIVCILVLFLGADAVGYTIVLFVFECLLALIVRHFALRHVSFTANPLNWHELGQLFNFSAFIFIQVLVAQIFWQVDKVLLGMRLGTEPVAVYAVALCLCLLMSRIASALRDVILPRATNLAVSRQDADTLTHFLVTFSRPIQMIYGLMLVGFTLVGGNFIHLWIGPEYHDTANLAMVLCWGSMLSTALSPGEELCRAYNRHRFLSVVYLLIALVNIVLTWLLIPVWGLWGAAVPTVVAQLVGVIIANVYYIRQFGIRLANLYAGVFRGNALVMAVTLLLGWPIVSFLGEGGWALFIIEVTIITSLYLLALRLFGLNTDERNVIGSLLHRIGKVCRRHS